MSYLDETLKEGMISSSDTESRFSDQDGMVMGVMVVEYLRDRFDLSDEEIIEHIQDYYSWMQEKYPDILEYVQRKGS